MANTTPISSSHACAPSCDGAADEPPADAYHELLVANHERLARWEPWAVQPPTPEGTRKFLEAAGRSWLEGSELSVAIAVLVGDEWGLVGSVGLRIDRSNASAMSAIGSTECTKGAE